MTTLPSWVARSAGAGSAGGLAPQTFSVNQPTTVNPGGAIVVYALLRYSSNPATVAPVFTWPSGYVEIGVSSRGGTDALVVAAAIKQNCSGSEAGVSISITCTDSLKTFGQINVRTEAFDNVATSITPFEGVASGNGTGTTVSDAGVVCSDVNRLACNIIGLAQGGSNIVAFSGQTGGTWAQETGGEFTSTSGTNGILDFQQADMASGGTIDGGTLTQTSHTWAVLGWALVPEPDPVPNKVVVNVSQAVNRASRY
jgi:hypothetical protein